MELEDINYGIILGKSSPFKFVMFALSFNLELEFEVPAGYRTACSFKRFNVSFSSFPKMMLKANLVPLPHFDLTPMAP